MGMVKVYYYLIKAKSIKNINEIPEEYKEKVTEYIADYGYVVAEDGAISKK